jgi:hypothetical protein
VGSSVAVLISLQEHLRVLLVHPSMAERATPSVVHEHIVSSDVTEALKDTTLREIDLFSVPR